MLKWHDAAELILSYVKKKFKAQIKAVSFIVIYLVAFQTLLLGLPIDNAISISIGLLAVVLGLTLFMEGLILGIMPIGESLGIKLPTKSPLFFTLLFAFILGIGATFAEPAIGVLRAMGQSTNAQSTPLLYYILNLRSQELVWAVSAGVGIAVVLGVLRFLYNWSLKPLIYPLVLTTLALSSWAFFDPLMAQVLGLAWDCGAVTTGPVTVPLVIALGIGISRVVTGHTDERATSGLGLVTLASLLPIITVLLLSLYYRYSIDFSQPLATNIPASDFLKELVDSSLMGSLKSLSWLKSASEYVLMAMQAIIPLCFLIFLVYRIVLRSKFQYLDEILLGLFLSVLGLAIFNFGIKEGLGLLGNQVGTVLPSAYTSIEIPGQQLVLSEFYDDDILVRFNKDGEKEEFFYFQKDKKVVAMPFLRQHYFAHENKYYLAPTHGPIWGVESMNFLGLSIVLIFSFFMGYGATLAEPALNTLGQTVEDISVGTFKKNILIQSVAFGVGLGITLGIAKIIWGFPLIYPLMASYLILLVLSYFSSEEFVNIAWDSAGVTTGPVTVPLVLALGLGIGSQSQALEGFGILAMASIFPIMTVLILGLWVKRNEAKLMLDDDLNWGDED